ncbi:MAG: hypothetical protein KY410_06185 [Proteobacteria bacterium]|nr:hypothetical protein [Pseudomonadota bacterium]
MNAEPQIQVFEPQSRAILSRFGYSALAPIVRIFMRFGWSARDLNDLVRWVYVKVFYTTPEFWRFGRPTALQGAIKTGIPRSIVKQIHAIPEPQQVLFTLRQNLAYRVIEGWVNDTQFHIDGKATSLPMDAFDGPSFRKLVARYGNDVTYGSVLGDLCDVGCVKYEDGVVTLLNQTYGMNFLDEDKLMISAYMLQHHGETADHNLVHDDIDERRLHRFWFNSGVPKRLETKARELIQEQAVEAGRKIDKLLAELAAGADSSEPRVELGLAMYFFQDGGIEEPKTTTARSVEQ